MTKTKDAGALAAATVGVMCSTLLAILWGCFWSGLTFSVLWGWFVVPLFGLPVLGVWAGYGVMLTVRAAVGLRGADKDSKGFGAQLMKLVVHPVLIAGLLLGIGWLVKGWM